MSRTTLCLLTAGALAALSIALMVTRHQVLGREIYHPSGPGTFKVTMLAESTSGQTFGDTRTFKTCIAGHHKKKHK